LLKNPTELNFLKSYYTLANSYYTLPVPKRAILGRDKLDTV